MNVKIGYKLAKIFKKLFFDTFFTKKKRPKCVCGGGGGNKFPQTPLFGALFSHLGANKKNVFQLKVAIFLIF